MRPGTHRRDAEEYAASSRYIIEFLLMILLLELERRDLLVFACICDEAALLFICRMDDNSRFKLEIRIVAPNYRGRWYSLEKIVDADLQVDTNEEMWCHEEANTKKGASSG